MQSQGNRQLASRIVILSAALAGLVAVAFLVAAGETRPALWAAASATPALAAILSNWFVRRALTQPLDQLHQALSVASRGGAWREPSRPAADEITRLNQSVGRIVEELEKAQGEVRLQKSLLDQRVFRRTEDLEAETKRAHSAAGAQREFLATMAQDLKQPVDGVLGTIDMVLDTKLTPEQRELLEASQRYAYSALALLNDVLDLARVETGELALESSPINVRSILEDSIRGLQIQRSGKQIGAVPTVDASVPRRLTGDPLRIRQIFGHLLSNALRLADGGEIKVHVLAAPVRENFELTVEVRYSGQDAPQGALAAASAGSSRSGAGLGLAIARKLVELHDGELTAFRDEAGKVLRARVVLGAAAEPAPDAPRSMARTSSDSPALDARSGAKILVAEDSLVNQKVIAAVLRKRGYRVEVAGDGKEALRIVECCYDTDPVQLILMDVQMPILDGLEATRALRQRMEWRKLPIVAMTAHSMSGDRERCLEAGMTGYIPKPVHATHLIQTIEEQLGGASQSPGSRSDGARPMLESYADISQGLHELFMQVAPDRMRRLTVALESDDRAALQSEARKVAAGAERIKAAAVSAIARRIEAKSPYLELQALREELLALDSALQAVDGAEVNAAR